jgi:prophage regulatory protein
MSSNYLRIKELAAYLKLSESTIYDRINTASPRYDPVFPKQRRLGLNTVVWLQSEVDAWVEYRKHTPYEKPNQGQNLAKKRKSIKLHRSQEALEKQTPKSTPPSSDLVPQLEFTEQFITSLRKAEYLKACLRLPTWTPAMAALLVSGVKAPLGCTEIPAVGEGIDGDAIVSPSDVRLKRARAIFEEWNNDLIEYDDDDKKLASDPHQRNCPLLSISSGSPNPISTLTGFV